MVVKRRQRQVPSRSSLSSDLSSTSCTASETSTSTLHALNPIDMADRVIAVQSLTCVDVICKGSVQLVRSVVEYAVSMNSVIVVLIAILNSLYFAAVYRPDVLEHPVMQTLKPDWDAIKTVAMYGVIPGDDYELVREHVLRFSADMNQEVNELAERMVIAASVHPSFLFEDFTLLEWVQLLRYLARIALFSFALSTAKIPFALLCSYGLRNVAYNANGCCGLLLLVLGVLLGSVVAALPMGLVEVSYILFGLLGIHVAGMFTLTALVKIIFLCVQLSLLNLAFSDPKTIDEIFKPFDNYAITSVIQLKFIDLLTYIRENERDILGLDAKGIPISALYTKAVVALSTPILMWFALKRFARIAVLTEFDRKLIEKEEKREESHA